MNTAKKFRKMVSKRRNGKSAPKLYGVLVGFGEG